MSDKVDTFLRRVAEAPAKVPRATPKRLGHFVVDSELGAGGMGVVYRALDESLSRGVALKVLASDLADDERWRERFLREARLAAAITHPNVAAIYEVGESDGWIYIAMELVAGRTLRSALTDGPLAIDEALRIGREVTKALARAHELNIVHRDLKPDNVMLTPAGDVKVLDFGLARREKAAAPSTSFVTRDGEIVGTPAYMSPEQSSGKHVDARSDVFSFGVMLFELLTGEPPFRGDTPGDLFTAIARDTPPPVSSKNTRAGADVDRVVAKCLAKDPAERYANATELLDALRSLEPRASRRFLLTTLTASLIAFGLVGAFAWAWSVRSQQKAPTAPSGRPAVVQSAAPEASSNAVAATSSLSAEPIASLVAPPHRRKYSGANGVFGGCDFSMCTGCESLPYVDAIRRQTPISNCFRGSQLDPPVHETVEYEVDVDPSGALTAFRPMAPLPAKLDACLRNVLKSAPLSKPSGGAGSFHIEFVSDCVEGWPGQCN